MNQIRAKAIVERKRPMKGPDRTLGWRSKPLLIALAVAAGCAGSYVAYVTVDRYAAIARAGVAIAMLYLLYIDYFVPHRSADTNGNAQFMLPQDLKYVLITFGVSLLVVWAGIQVVHLIWWLSTTFQAGS